MITEENFYKVIQTDSDHYRIYCPLGVFMDLFVGAEKALLLDTGYGFGDLNGLVKSLTSLPLLIVNTHGHVDHACGNWQFAENVYIHPLDMELCRQHNGEYRRGLALNYAKHCPDPLTGEEQNLLPPDVDEQAYLKRGCGNLVPLAEGQIFDLGGIHLRTVWVPGHTGGSIGLIDEEKKIFYSGDSMNFSTWLFLPEAEPLHVYKDSIRRMLCETFDRIMFSHAEALWPKSVLLDFLDLAEHVDYETGYPFSAPLAPGAIARYCVRKGYSMQDDMSVPGFASIVIGPDKLC